MSGAKRHRAAVIRVDPTLAVIVFENLSVLFVTDPTIMIIFPVLACVSPRYLLESDTEIVGGKTEKNKRIYK